MSSDNIGTYEEYLFAKDKKEFLESCKNSSELKQYIRLCHLLNHPEIVLEQTDRDLLNRWSNGQCYGDKKNLVVKDQLLAILNEGNADKRKTLIQAFNNKFLQFSFYDERIVSGTQAANNQATGSSDSLKSAMTSADWDTISTASKISQIETSENGSISFNLNDIGENNTRKIDLTKVKNWNLKEQILNSLPTYAQNPVEQNLTLEYR